MSRLCFRIVLSADGIKNKLEVNLSNNFKMDVTEKDLNEEVENDRPPRIEWNVLKRCWMSEETNEAFKYKLIRNRLWPVEFMIDIPRVNT